MWIEPSLVFRVNFLSANNPIFMLNSYEIHRDLELLSKQYLSGRRRRIKEENVHTLEPDIFTLKWRMYMYHNSYNYSWKRLQKYL